jgi:hypothetical protein
VAAGAVVQDGSLTINVTGVVPESSTWAMMLAGFAGLGLLTGSAQRPWPPDGAGTIVQVWKGRPRGGPFICAGGGIGGRSSLAPAQDQL